MENFQLYRWQSHSTIRKALVQQQQQQTSQWVLTLVPINLVSTRKTKSRCPTLLCIFTLCHSWPGCYFIQSTGLNFSPDLYITVMAKFVFVILQLQCYNCFEFPTGEARVILFWFWTSLSAFGRFLNLCSLSNFKYISNTIITNI